MQSGKLLIIYICNFHVLSHLLLIYICKLHWNISENKRNAQKFVAIGGLKYVFPMLMGKGLPKVLKSC